MTEKSIKPTLWAIHVPGPDDYYAAPTKVAAQHMADKHNAAMAKYLESHPVGLPPECAELLEVTA